METCIVQMYLPTSVLRNCRKNVVKVKSCMTAVTKRRGTMYKVPETYNKKPYHRNMYKILNGIFSRKHLKVKFVKNVHTFILETYKCTKLNITCMYPCLNQSLQY